MNYFRRIVWFVAQALVTIVTLPFNILTLLVQVVQQLRIAAYVGLAKWSKDEVCIEATNEWLDNGVFLHTICKDKDLSLKMES